MYLIVGLGNHGKQYENTRHNVGFMVIDHMISDGMTQLEYQKLFQAEIAEHEDIVLVKPHTFMNNSGAAVSKLLHAKYPDANVIVVHDDITLALGQVKISKGAGAGNHHGVQSVIDHIKTKDFIRVRCGIGRGNGILSDVVLSKFKPDEKTVVGQMIQHASGACIMIVEAGVEKAMNAFN